MSRATKPYAPSDIVRVFDAAWEVIRPKSHTIRPRTENRLRLDLARAIIALAESGVTDATELRRQAIEQFVLSTETDGGPREDERAA
jgi:hypothetical protein